MDQKTSLIRRLDDARASLENVISTMDPKKEIYPGWTLKHLLDHIAGWDDAVIASLRAHYEGRPPETPAELGIDLYNAQTVATRESLDFKHSVHEFRTSRLLLKQIINSSPEVKLNEPLIAPWGHSGTVAGIIDIFIEHEETHTKDILRRQQGIDKAEYHEE